MNNEWAMSQLDIFIAQTTVRQRPPVPGIPGVFYHTVSTDEEITKQAQVVESILDRAIRSWRKIEADRYKSRWMVHHFAAIRAREALLRAQEIRENLGENAPELPASDFHPWIWGGAASLWHSGHLREAIKGAIRKLNAETQNKVRRRDVSETDLFNQSFTLEAAQSGKPRLRRMKPDDSRTSKNVQRGAMQFAEGIFAGIRNPLAHEDEHDLTEQQALEYLAALSVLARWVDDATVERMEAVP